MIKLDNLQKRYKNFELNLSLEVPEGTVIGLIGKNGAGKSTTIKAILGLLKPTGGSVTVFGKNPLEFTVKDREAIGTALSDSGFSMNLTAKDVVAILSKFYADFDKESFIRQCEQGGLALDKPIKDYSTGMKAKLRVLTALSHKAKLLILDEPTAGLDVLARGEILDMLRNYLEEDSERSILISSHISSDLEGLCDEIYMIDDGKLILHEDTDVIMGKYGILKLSADEYEKLDKSYILATRKEAFGYSCLTNEKQYYLDNYPNIVIENNDIDNMIVLMLGGKIK